MIKQVGLIALGLSMAFLSGCGGGSDNNDGGVTPPPEETNLNIPAEVEKNIIGSWNVGCQNIDNGSRYETDKAIFNADGTGEHEGAEYASAGCIAGDEIDEWSDTFTYTLGGPTTSSDGKDAVDINIILAKTGNYYTMLHFTAIDKFIMADTDDEEDGDTPERRENSFTGKESWVYIKQ